MRRIADVVALIAGTFVVASSFAIQFTPQTRIPPADAPPCSAWTPCPGEPVPGAGDLTQFHGGLALLAIAACVVVPLARLTLGRLAIPQAARIQAAALVVSLAGLGVLAWHATGHDRWLGYQEWNHQFSLRAGAGLHGMVIGVSIALSMALTWTISVPAPIGRIATAKSRGDAAKEV
jgi:hypothetical protein